MHKPGPGAGVSLGGVVIGFVAHSLPVVQFVALLVSIVAGTLSIVSWFQKRKRNPK
jgi:hypothetical protein